MKQRSVFCLNLILIVALSLTLLGCGGSSKSGSNVADLSGVWQDKECDCQVVIDMRGDSKSMTIADQKMAVTVKSFVNDKVLMSVNDGNGNNADWELIRVWSDEGSTFSLALIRNGKRESLSLIKKLS